MDKKKKDMIIGIAVLTWFFGSIFAMLYSFGIGQIHLGLALFAQYFIVFGLIFTIGAKSKIGLTGITVGALILICVGIDAFGTDNLKRIFTAEILVGGFGALLFLITGICVLFIPRYIKKGKIKRCTVQLQAECVNYKSNLPRNVHSNQDRWIPVWKYYFNGEFHTSYYNFAYSSRHTLPKIGDTTELFLNPEDYNDIYVKMPFFNSIFMDFMGIICLLSSGMMTYFIIIEILEIL